MIRPRVDPEPARLVSEDDRAGRLLLEADQAFKSQLSPDLAWNRFQSRRHRRGLFRFAALATAVSLSVAFVRHRLVVREPSEPAMLVAEQVPPPEASAPAPQRAAVLERRISPSASSLPRSRSALSALPMAVSASSRGSVSSLPTEPLTEATCRGLAGQARPERAVDCYQTIARESGIGAEVALYEAARLSAEALGDASAALALLEQHGTRFPNSVLRVEVAWLKIRSLERTGRLDEALSASEALLDSAVGRTLSPQLHLLRGRIYADSRRECRLALPEFVALLGDPGSAGDEAELKRAQCLEQLDRGDEARAAYERYLARPDARSAEVARARLNLISNLPQASEGQP